MSPAVLSRAVLALGSILCLGGTAFGQTGRQHADTGAQGLPGRVASFTITANGARSNDVSGEETAWLCSRFRLRRQDVQAFFAVAQIVDARAYHHDLEISRCHAAGRVRFGNGAEGQWRIDMERRGLLRLHDGRSIFLYCPRCTARAFEPVYDPDREG